MVSATAVTGVDLTGFEGLQCRCNVGDICKVPVRQAREDRSPFAELPFHEGLEPHLVGGDRVVVHRDADVVNLEVDAHASVECLEKCGHLEHTQVRAKEDVAQE